MFYPPQRIGKKTRLEDIPIYSVLDFS